MRGRKNTTSQWYCDARCHPKRSPKRKPCKNCCGFTVDSRRQATATGEAAA